MSRMTRLAFLLAFAPLAGAGSIADSTQGLLYRAWGFEWTGGAPDWLSVANLGGGAVTEQTITGDSGLQWEVPPDCCHGGEGDVRSYILPDFAAWRDVMLWRMTTSQGGLRVSEQIRSDRFQVDLSGSAAFDIVVNTLQWRLHPMANHDPGYDVGVHEGHARTEYLIYWESPQSPPLPVYTFTWADSAVAEDFSGYELNSFTVPYVDEPVYECDPNEGCVQTGTIVKASGVLWWERAASMDLVHTAEVPETGPGWLVFAGLLMSAAARVGRRGRPDHRPRPLAR